MFITLGQGSGFNVSGRVDSGHVQVGEHVLILPAQETVSIKCMYMCVHYVCLLQCVYVGTYMCTVEFPNLATLGPD